MSSQVFRAFIRAGVNSSVKEINTRSGPSTDYEVPFRVATGAENLEIMDVQSDENNATFNGKLYQWFLLAFPNGQSAWIRDDLIDVVGDGSRFGYGFVAGRVFALELNRATSDTKRTERSLNPLMRQAKDAFSENASSDEIEEETKPATLSEDERVILAAFNITGAFEGSGYASYQTYDKGLISYGRFQFTLLSGSLAAVVNRYIELSDDRFANALEQSYQAALNERKESLRDDARLKMLLQNAAQIPAMQQAQNNIANEQYWQRMYKLSVVPRNVQTPLAQAMFFDISIQHGTHHSIFTTAEDELGVPNRSRVGENGIPETRFIARCAEVRRRILYRIADAQRLPGVKKRADVWIELIKSDDWQLQGDASGNINVLGRKAQVRNP